MINTLFVGKVYHRFDELTSTNDWALELTAKSKPPEGTVIRADMQTVGRGQFGSRWESAPGKNLLLSIILYPHWLPVNKQFYLSMAIALAVKDAIQHPDSVIKWPNDLYLGQKKTAGILLQNSLHGHSLQSSIVGIGLNVNQQEFDPALPNPTSLAVYMGHHIDLDALMERLFSCVEHRYLQLKSGRLEDVKRAYESVLFRREQRSVFLKKSDQSIFEGTILGVSESGRLQVEIATTGIVLFDLKEVQLLV
jgi:BirA family biotin operon repressor/biotin-[acetyl-CoA-carboxylase] ligase